MTALTRCHRSAYRYIGWVFVILFAIIPLLTLPGPIAAQTGDQGFASAVACLSGDVAIATTCFADTIFAPVPANDPALVRVTLSGAKQPLVPIGTIQGGHSQRIARHSGIGSVYGLAYDDGAISGIRRLFAAAFTRRFTSFGPLGVGGVYEYRFDDGQWYESFTVPNAGRDRPSADQNDTAILEDVGKTGLGDMEISPDGTTLYIMNLATRQIERYDVTQSTPQRLEPLSINYRLITSNRQTLNNLRPFALEFAPTPDAATGNPRLFIGITDTASPDGEPNAYVLEWIVHTDNWQRVIAQPLITSMFNERFHNSTYLWAIQIRKAKDNITGWNAWNEQLQKLQIYHPSRAIFHAQPFLTDIEFSPNGQELRLGLRDRLGDLTFFGPPPAGHYTAIAQGDTLNYRFINGYWQLEQLNSLRKDQVHINDPQQLYIAHRTDWLNDHLHSYPGDRPAHVENHMGSILAIPSPDGYEQIVVTSLLGANSSGLMAYHRHQPHPFRAITLIPPGSNKSTSLGDLELLCTYAFISGQLWHDVNGNGIREATEPPLNGVTLQVMAPDQSTPLGEVVTDNSGRYTVAVPPNRALHVRVAPAAFTPGRPLAGMVYAPVNVGGDDTRDSDAHPSFGVVEFAGRHTGNGVTGTALPLPLREESVRNVDIGLTRQFQPAAIGDRVWLDQDRNGLQDNNEPGVAGVSLRLERLPGSAPQVTSYPRTTFSDAQGSYSFAGLEPGRYRVFVTLPDGHAFAPLTIGGDPQRDSDIDERTSFSSVIVLGHGEMRTDIDVGLVQLQTQMDLSIDLRAPTTAVVGDELQYTMTYRHTGQRIANNVVIQLEMPVGATLLNADQPPTRQDGIRLIWQLPRLSQGSTGTINVRVRAPTSIGNSLVQTVTAIATISATPADGNTTNNRAQRITQLTRAEVSVSKSAPAVVLSGDELLYTLRVVNRGSAVANNVVVTDPLPSQVDFVSFLQAPAGACRYEGVQRTVRCTLSSLSPNQEVTVSILTRPRPNAADRLDNRVTVTTTTAGDLPLDNVATTRTVHVRPDLAVSLVFTPTPAAAGEANSLLVSYRNNGSGMAQATVLTIDLPAAITITTVPSVCQRNAQQLVCALGDVAPATSGELRIGFTLPATIALDQLTAQAVIATATPELSTAQGDNTANATVAIVRPNPFVLLRGPASIVGQGSVFAYTIDYGNRYHRRPTQTRAATDTVLELELPADVQFVGASLSPSTRNGQRLRWNLGTLNPQTAGRLEVVVQTNVPAGTVLPATARISTVTPADDPVDNVATLTVSVVPPPSTIGRATGELQVAIRSTLDPAMHDANETNGVYLSEGAAITWPAGEVLDLTPQLATVIFADEPLPWPYAYRVRVVGWSLATIEVGKQRFDPRAADSRGVAGCREGVRPTLKPQLLTGCIYGYLGGQSRDHLRAIVLRERDLNDQAHLYWGRPPVPAMRSDVYLYTTDVLDQVRLTVQLELEVQIVNQAPGSIGGIPLPPVPVVPLPDPARQLITEQVNITLLAPRSLVAPGN